ncbi:MAG: flagellar motor switch protein FliM [Planctomycetota bacterium]
MSDETLSQNQVESLLAAMDSAGGNEPQVAAAPEKDQPAPVNPLLDPSARISPYDFKRPERVGKEQMRAMQNLHENIARNFGAAISGLLRAIPEVKLLSVDQLTYSEFVFSLDNPSCFAVIEPKPLEGNWILDLSPTLTYAMIDRMLGGDPSPESIVRRPMTEIETRLISRVIEYFLKILAESWENVVELELEIDRVQSNPQMVQIVPPNEVVILLGFELVLGKNRGMINLCIPFNGIEQYNNVLSTNSWASYGKQQSSDETKTKVVGSMSEALVDVRVTLAKSRIRTSDLLDLTIGDVITTETEVREPLELSIQDVPKFNARPGAYRGKKAIRIESIITD